MITEHFISDFNGASASVGPLTTAKWRELYDHARSLRSDCTARVSIEDGDKCIEHFYGEGTYGSLTGLNEWRSLTTDYPILPLEEVWWSFRFKWEEGFEYPISGKLYGVTVGTFGEGGGPATGGQGPASTMQSQDKGGSIRLNPTSSLKLRFYVYDYNMTTKYGRDGGIAPFGQMVPGQWHRLTCRAIMNYPRDLDNGVCQVWLDGALVATMDDIWWTKPGITPQQFKLMSCGTFTGGGDSRWNSPKDQSMWQSDMKIWSTDDTTRIYSASDIITTPFGTVGGDADPEDPTPQPPLGTVTIGNISRTSDSASVIYTYNNNDQTGFEYRVDGGTATTASASPIVLTGLEHATDYTIEVRAINANGNGTWASKSFTTLPIYVPPVDLELPFPVTIGSVKTKLKF